MRTFLTLAVVAAQTLAAAASEKAPFVSGTYAREGQCAALAAINAGGDRNVETVPEILTPDGFTSWEGSCLFAKITEIEKGRVWQARMECAEAADEWEETDTFTLDPNDQSITVTVEDKSTKFVRCDSEKGN